MQDFDNFRNYSQEYTKLKKFPSGKVSYMLALFVLFIGHSLTATALEICSEIGSCLLTCSY